MTGPLRLVHPEEIRAAADRLRDTVRRTPLVPVELPTDGGNRDGPPLPEGPRLWLKCESLQHVSAFKVRGAYNFVSRVDPEERQAGLITYSSGNHAQGVAFAARVLGLRATIVMPVDAPAVKREATRALGAGIVEEGTTSAERQARAEELLRERGGVMVPPFDHPDIIAGQGTVGLEIVEQLAQARAADGGGDVEGGAGGAPPRVLAPIGGGGLISGVAAAVKRLAPGARVVGVEPEGAASMLRSLEAGEPVTLDRVETVADGLKPVRPGDWTFHHCRELVDEVVTVDDDAIRAAVRWLYRRRLVVEPSGAATTAALLSGRVPPTSPTSGPTVAVVSGGNVDPALYAEWIV